jgi:hypothetical protein
MLKLSYTDSSIIFLGRSLGKAGSCMKFSVWDALSILTLMGLCVVGIVVATIFANPASAFNPFPPPTLPASIVLPSNTPTAVFMPPTWTPVGFGPKTLETVASQTPLPSATGFVLPSYTPTFTVTPSPTETETPTPTVPTHTPAPSSTHKPSRTPTPYRVDLSIDSVSPNVSPPGSLTVLIVVSNNGTNRVSSASFSNTLPKTLTGVTCKISGFSCKTVLSGSVKKSTASLKLDPGASVTITITAGIPATVTSSFKDVASIYPPSSETDIDLGNNQSSSTVTP